jgi:hypothetical protein
MKTPEKILKGIFTRVVLSMNKDNKFIYNKFTAKVSKIKGFEGQCHLRV